MKKYLLVFCFVFLLYSFSSAQNTWQGKIIDEKGVPIEFVNVLLLNADDDTFKKGVLTNNKGEFVISSDNASLEMLKISLIGYEDKYVDLLKDESNNSLGTIVIKEDLVSLNEVNIVAKKPLFEQLVDRTVVNVENSLVSTGNNVLSILSRSPSVVVDRSNDEIQLMGNQGVVIMINDKPIRMEAAELLSFLESMSSDNIKNIELITNPPSSYDAQGNAGIININTKKEDENGLIGNIVLNSGYGVGPKYGGSINVNYKQEKLNIYTNVSTSFNDSKEEYDVSFLFEQGESLVSNNPITVRDYQVALYSGEVGVDYELHKNHSFGFLFSGQIRDWLMDSNALTDRITDDELITTVNNNEEINYLFRTLSNINYKIQISPKSQLSFDYDYISFKRENPTEYSINSTFQDLTTQRDFAKSNSETPLDISVVAINYENKLNEPLELETGLKWTASVFENYLIFEDQINGSLVTNPLFTDDFYMDEDIYAAYLSMGWEISKKCQFKGGTRYEFYQIDLRSLENGNLLNRKNGRFYTNLFFRYNVSENVDLNFSYSERVERPGFLTLAPAFYFYDQFSLFTGNPTIIPTISKRTKLDIRYKKFNLNILYAKYENPVFQLQPDIDDDLGLHITRPLQANDGNTLSISASFPFKISGKWSSRLNTNFNRVDQRPIIEGQTINDINLNYNILFTNSYQLSKDFEFEFNGQYYSKFQYSAAIIQPRWSVDLGLKKKFKGGQSLTFNATDIFNTFSQYEVLFDAPAANIEFQGDYNLEGPIFRLSYSMPFGNKKIKNKSKRESKSNEEQQRLN